ncbi:MAG: strictosidine synthase family protein [Planctomycetes bacterium]|nr:strictosidine synthase family protein [Planctomycetota bacterium]
MNKKKKFRPPPPGPYARLKRGLAWGFSLLALLAAYLLFWPIDVEPVVWTPPTPVAWASNDALAKVERLGVGLAAGPEDVAIDAKGRIYVGLADGRIMRFPPGGGTPELAVDTTGRPLGLGFDSHGLLWIADAAKGLLCFDPQTKALVTHSSEAAGVRFGFTDDLDIAADGTIYFSDASSKFGVEDFKLDLIEHGLNGRLLAYDPTEKLTRVVLGDLQFANGVAVSADQTFVLVVETGNYRVVRYWLTGEKKGQHDVFIDNLPGFPDGISANPRGGFWLALASPRDPLLDSLADSPGVRKVIARLPAFAQPSAKRHGWVLGLDANGKVTHDLQHNAPDSFSPVTSVQEHEGQLYLGSLSFNGFGKIAAPK